MRKIYKNTRYYKYMEDDTLIEVRVLGFANSDMCKCKVISGPSVGAQIKIPIKTLQNEYTKLIQDGIVIFNTVQIQKDLEDVMVTVLTKEKVDIGYTLPTVVCRQCVLDVFAKQFSNRPNNDYVGLSISEETCPADIEFENFLACESIIDSEICSYYIGDTLDHLLSLFSHTKFDNILQNLLTDHCNQLRTTNPGLAEYFLRKGEANGFVNNLVDLLKLNNFEYDLYRAFNIIPTTLSKDNFDDGVLTKYAESVLSNILRVNIYKTLVLKYDKDIDLKSITKKYALVSDNEGTVYIVAYFSNGTYQVDENGEMLESKDSIAQAYENIKFTQDKYKK